MMDRRVQIKGICASGLRSVSKHILMAESLKGGEWDATF